MVKEEVSFLETKKKKKLGSRGESAQDQVQEFLTKWRNSGTLDFDRLYDTRSCGRILPQQVADFTYCFEGRAGAIEVKETEHECRLTYTAFPQFPKMRRRMLAGGHCWLIVLHTTIGRWRIVPVQELPVITKGGWDLTEFPLQDSLELLRGLLSTTPP
jgi:hypothetical protein